LTGIRPEINARDRALVAGHDGLQHSVPSIGVVNIPGTKRTSFKITELGEHEQQA
jgi:hypothetical protein